MARNYGYSLQFNYLLVPHSASLHLVTTGEDGKPAPRLVHEFKDATSYERFQKMRDEYLLLSVNEAKQATAEAAEEKTDGSPATETLETPALADATESGPAPAPSPQPTTSEPSPALKAMQEELIGEFDYDPTKNHQVNLEKTALYARPARQ